MNTNDLITRSIYIITEYYENNTKPFFDNIADDVLWLGPAEGQVISGKQNVLEAWSKEHHSLTFTMGDIRSYCVSPHTHVREITLCYDIYTHFPSGNTDKHDQRIHYTWREKRVRGEEGWEWHPEIVMLHISNLWRYDKRDTIYPVHYENLYGSILYSGKTQRYVTVKAPDRSVYRLLADRILYIETVKRSARLLVHTKDDTIMVNGKLPDLERDYPNFFVRIHASYLINPLAVREIHRFAVTLSDGTELPIPEKKYTRVKKQLMGGD